MLINNRYQVIRSLGEGGFGQAYLATDTHLPSQRQCVVKQLKPITSNTEVYELIQARFQREAAILEQLGENHPQIPRLYAYFTEAKNFYLVQEWIEGTTLESLSLPQSESIVRTLLIAILPVLEFVHTQSIIHRDIKPGNIILRADSQQPVLIDFGAVKETVNTAMGGSSASSIVIGTPGYMPAEQAAGRPLASSDLYSLALTGVYLLTGKSPQELPSDAQTGEILLQQAASGVSSDLIAVLTKAMQYHPRDRYNSASEMLAALTSTPKPDSLPINTLAPTVIHPAVSSPLPAVSPSQAVNSQPANSQPTNQLNRLETDPTEVRAPANSQPESGTTAIRPHTSQTQAESTQPKKNKYLTQGLVGTAVASAILFGGWATTRSTDSPVAEPGISTEITETNTNPPLQTPSTLTVSQACFDLAAYDPEDNTVNVRDTPDGSVIETIPNLSLISVERPTTLESGWRSVSVNDTGTQGYIWGELLYRAAYLVNDPTDTSANMRDAPNGNIIEPIDNGEVVEFLGIEGEWTHVKLGGEQTGYISTALLAEPDCP